MSVLPRTSCLLLLFLILLVTDAEQQQQQQQHQVKQDKPRSRPATPPADKKKEQLVHISGELTTRDGHRCIWQTSGNVRVNLLLNCSTETRQEGTRAAGYWCRYAGKPDLCLSYGVKASLYWKSLMETLRKRRNTCEGEKVLKVRACKKAPAEAHMKLTQRGRNEDEKEDKSKREVMMKRSVDEERTEEKKKDQTFSEEIGVMDDMVVRESYCSDRWRSICSFLLKVFEGE